MLHRCLFPQSFPLLNQVFLCLKPFAPEEHLHESIHLVLFLQNHTVNWSRSTKMLNFILQNNLNEKEKKNSYDLDEQTAEVISFVWSHLRISWYSVAFKFSF